MSPHRPTAAAAVCCIAPLVCLSSATSQQLQAAALFAPNHLVRVDIELAEQDWNKLRKQTRTIAGSLGKVPQKRPFTYFKGHVTIDGVRIENVGIRKKGFLGSLDSNRPSLKIKFAEYEKQRPVQGLDRLTLNNNKQDPSLINQTLSFKLFRTAGVPASRCNHARVTMNGTLLGVYSNVESLKAPMLQRNFGESAGELYEGTLADFFPAAIDRFQTKTKKSELDLLRPLAELCNAKTLDLAAIERLLDLDAFLKFWAVESLVGHWDGYANNQNNFFVYRAKKNAKLYFLPWGPDSAFTTRMPLPPYQIRIKTVFHRSMLCNRLYQLPAIQKRYKAVFEQLLTDVWKEDEVYAETRRVEALLAGHVHERQARYADGLKKIRSFTKVRRRSLRRELDRWPAKLTQGPRMPMHFKPVGSATMTFDTNWLGKGRGTGSLELLLNGKPVELGPITIKSAPSTWPSPNKGPKPPTVVITAKRKSDGQQIIMAISVERDDFHASKGKPVIAQGALIEGALGFLARKGPKMAAGEAIFEEAAMTPGAPIRGRATVKIVQMEGGSTSRFRPR